MNSRKWFKEAKFGMFVHFGLYSILAGEWKGDRKEGEWIRHKSQIPYDEYHRLADVFNPIYFNADEWVKIAKDAGMKYFVMTAKHHDGFAMYHSKVSKFNVVDATPFGRDIVKELAESCYKHGLKFGLYYSHDLDWDEPDAGGFIKNKFEDKGYNYWDFPEKREFDFSKYFENKALPQLEEILTNYGDLCLIWFDNPWTLSKEQSQMCYDLVKKYQPDCLVNSRVGNGLGDYKSGPDNGLDMHGDLEKLYECPATMNGTWGYKAYDVNYKTAQEIIEIKNSLNSRGINYLLNVGPDHLGRIPGQAVEILSELNK